MRLKTFFKEEENVLILNSIYIRPEKDDDTNKWSNPRLNIVYKDLDTGIKKLRIIDNPATDTFITKSEYKTFKTQRQYLNEDQVERYNVPYNKLTRFICDKIKEDGKDKDYLNVCADIPKESFKWRHSYFADYDINDYILISQALKLDANKDNPPKYELSTGFLDIESDIYEYTSEQISNAEDPINAVSIVVSHNESGKRLKNPVVYTLLLRNYKRYSQQEYFEKHLDKFVSECHDEFDKKYNYPKFAIKCFDDERDLLKTLFALIYKLKLDFIMIWNMTYDIPKIYNRLIRLGENPINYFCHPDFGEGYCRYNYDMIYKNDIKNSCESFDCTSYTSYVDQMRHYAGIRKSKSDYGGNSLDNVAHIELNAEKRKYDGKTVTVINGALEEYWNFVKYSINDVLLQYGIENRTEDLYTLFEQSMYGGTRLSKTLKQSVYLKNVYAIEYFIRNIVPKNNNNVNYSRFGSQDDATNIDEYNSHKELSGYIDYDDFSLPGALVGDPKLNDNQGVMIMGSRSNAYFKYVIDLDFTAMYPNAKITANISPYTQYGRIIIETECIKDENPDNNPKFMRGGKFIEDYSTDDGSNVARWIGIKPTHNYLSAYGEYRNGKKKREI